MGGAVAPEGSHNPVSGCAKAFQVLSLLLNTVHCHAESLLAPLPSARSPFLKSAVARRPVARTATQPQAPSVQTVLLLPVVHWQAVETVTLVCVSTFLGGIALGSSCPVLRWL